MPVDDNPIEVARRIIQSDRRSSTEQTIAKVTVSAIGLFPGAREVLDTVGLKDAFEYLMRIEEDNVQYLLSVVADEVVRLEPRIRNLEATSTEHSDFLHNQLPPLIIDAVQRSRRVRARDRIAHLARIVANASIADPLVHADEVEEFLRVAVEVSGLDVGILDAYSRLEVESRRQHALLPEDEQQRGNPDTAAWFKLPATLSLPIDVVESVGAKLYSFGLVRASSNLSGDRSSYALLMKGRRFLEFVKSHAAQ